MAPDASLLRGALCLAEEELCVGVRVSWRVAAALNQPVLCNCQLEAFMSCRGLLLERGYTGVASHHLPLSPMQRYFQLAPLAACTMPAARKEAPAEVSTEVVF